MSNVLLGIVGVILFIGLALAGASYFGVLASTSVMEAKAQAPLQALGTVAKAVAVRDRELEAITPSAADASVLVPDYLDELPRNPLNGSSVMLLSRSGTVTGAAAIVAAYVSPGDADMCAYMNQVGGSHNASIPNFSGQFPAHQSGCVKMPSGSGIGDDAGYVAYAWVK